MFSKKLYKQIDGVTVEFPLGPALDNIFLRNKWLKDCPHDLKPVFYRCCVDDIFVLFSSLHHTEKLQEYLSSKHPSTSYSFEKEWWLFIFFRHTICFVKTKNFSLMFPLQKTFSVVLILIKTACCLKPLKLI